MEMNIVYTCSWIFCSFFVGFMCGAIWGHCLGLGKPKESLPPEGTILKVETVAPDNIFHAFYKGKMMSFKSKQQQKFEPGYYKVISETWKTGKGIEYENRVLSRVSIE